jgi:N-acetylneuraminic acid mutarotase
MIHSSHMYVFGGISVTGSLNDFYRFDTTSLTWTEIGSIAKGSSPPPRYNFHMVAVNETIYVFSGVKKAGIGSQIDEYYGDFYKFDTVIYSSSSRRYDVPYENPILLMRC